MADTKAVLETNFGTITLKFFTDVAPGHVKNFIDLAKKGFYDGTTFHRVIPGFMIQGGDPNSKDANKSRHGQGGPGYTIKAEFNDKPHKRGTLSMARAGHPDSAGSQFFLCVKDSSFLDKQYTVFGEVESGIEVVDKIVSQPRDGNDNPNDRIDMKVKIEEDGELLFYASDETLKCPKCGSTQLGADKKGFGTVKAAGGLLLAGPLGLLLGGSIGSKQVLITCLKCGKQWNAGSK